MRRRVVQWQGDNAEEAERLLSNHLARADKHGDKLHLIGLGINVELNLGDSLILDGDRIGIQRAATKEPLVEEFVTWTGDLPAVERFLKRYVVRLEVRGTLLALFGDDSGIPWFVLSQGDRLVKRDGQIIISKLGNHHRH
jgi:hypothetical protein